MKETEQRGAIGFAEKILELLDEGRFVATYKYAVLLALMDVCLEQTERTGMAPQTVTTRQLAEKIVEIYWPHSMPFTWASSTRVLRQNTEGQAKILSVITAFRERHALDPSVPRWTSRMAVPDAYRRMVTDVEWILIQMPLPRLQMMGQSQRRFIYDIAWDTQIRRTAVAPYLRDRPSGFDNRLMLRDGVGGYFLQLNGLLRPLIQRRWAAMVAHLNRLEESQLEEFLFGADRIRTAKIRIGLWEIQGRRCFYCHARVREPVQAHVDHFVPWARYPDNRLDNLVVADKACNASKSSSLAAAKHVSRWVTRFDRDAAEFRQLDDLSERAKWDRHPDRSLSVARAIYLRLPADARLWLRERVFVPPEPGIGASLT